MSIDVNLAFTNIDCAPKMEATRSFLSYLPETIGWFE